MLYTHQSLKKILLKTDIFNKKYRDITTNDLFYMNNVKQREFCYRIEKKYSTDNIKPIVTISCDAITGEIMGIIFYLPDRIVSNNDELNSILESIAIDFVNIDYFDELTRYI